MDYFTYLREGKFHLVFWKENLAFYVPCTSPGMSDTGLSCPVSPCYLHMSSEPLILLEAVSTLGLVVFALHSHNCCSEPFSSPFLHPGNSSSESKGKCMYLITNCFPHFLFNPENLINMELTEFSSEHLDKG